MTTTIPHLPSLPSATEGASRGSLLKRYGVFGLGLAAAVVASAREPHPKATHRRAALAEILGARGLTVEPDGVVFLDLPRGAIGAATSRARALVVASSGSDPSELYLVETRVAPNGVLVDVLGDYNLSDTIGAQESVPVVSGERAAFVSKSLVPGSPDTVIVLDFHGQQPTGWPLVERAQNALTNLQDTGQLRGVDKRTLTLSGETKGEVHLAFDGDTLDIESDGRRARYAAVSAALSQKEAWVTVETNELARPGNLTTWSVDRVRAVIGDESMQAIKQYAFTAKDFIDRNKETLTNDTGAAGIAEDLGENELDAPKKVIPVDPEIGWPPPPLKPMVTPELPGEGEWNAKDDAAFFRQQPNLPATFITTFIRTDPTRKATRVYIALWDPRQVELHMMAGTVEPKSATGKAGPGLIPRTPDVMKRVVAASNAGFQALHGEYGMMADGVVYLPPKPYAATVAELRDGSTAFGTWPDSAEVPDTVLSYRQNMTVMVQDEKFNPFNRTWWGGTVPGAEDKTHTVRSGICLTKEGFVGYFYGADLSPEALAQSMIQARCSYGIALDMNAGHSGLEFYKVAPDAELPALDRPLQRDWEAEGSVPEMEGWSFRARRLIRGMGLMNFPRYIKREARDYFYLTLRHVLPGENIVVEGQKDGDGLWKVKGLPQHGFPYALATTELHLQKADAAAVFRVLEVDPRTIAVAGAKDPDDKTVMVVGGPEDKSKASLWLASRSFSIGEAEPVKGAARLAGGDPDATEGAAIVGVNDESGMLLYVEAPGPKADLKPARELLQKLGYSQVLTLDKPLPLALGGSTSLAGEAIHPPSGKASVRLMRADAPSGKRFFEDTPIVSKDVWYPLQQQRVRYFKKHE